MSTRDGRPAGHTRWRRMILVMVPTLGVSAAVIAAMATGAVPVSIAISTQAAAISGQEFQIAADTLQGHRFTQFVTVQRTARGDYPEAMAGIKSADLYNLCQSSVTDVPVFGKVTLLIKAGSGGKPVHADNLVVSAEELSGDAVFNNIVIGSDASAYAGAQGLPTGTFGQQSESLRIDHLRQQTRSVTASTFRLTGLHLSVAIGSKPCF